MRRTRTIPVFASFSAVLGLALAAAAGPADDAPKPVKALIITGDAVKAHNWKGTTEALKDILPGSGRIQADVTTAPSQDLTDAKLAGYDVLVLNYFNTPQGAPETKWSDANKAAFLKAIHDDGKGLVVIHHASGAFANPNWPEFEKAIAGGWRYQRGFHGPPHEFTVKKTDFKHPVSEGAPESFDHVTDELYSNSLLTPGSVVLATAYCDPGKPKGTGKDEAVIWVSHYGKGRVFNCALGHDVNALSDPPVKAWLTRGTEWAGTGWVRKKAE
jgi:type 1 glutamine amidotransferase